MKVGIIGLGRMGLGMSRRMMRDGIEVWGYRRNYEKAQEAFENGGGHEYTHNQILSGEYDGRKRILK